MGCRTETIEIDDHEYSVTQWSAEKALLMKFRLTKLFGAPIAKLAATIDTKEKKGKISIDDKNLAESLGNTLSELFMNNSPEEITNFMKECIIDVAYDGTKITNSTFNQVFDADSISNIYRVFFFVIKVNYSNLMKGRLVEVLSAKVKDIL